jgi:hypothetical protein
LFRAENYVANETTNRQSSRTMDIDSFVSQALEQLGSGITKARNAPSITISPLLYGEDASIMSGGHLMTGRGINRSIISFVEFDLSVVVQSRVEGSAGAKAKLEVIGLDLGGAEAKGALDHTHVQRIKFQVPVSFPAS